MTSTVGGPSRKTLIGRTTHWIECGVLALVLASCGGGDGGTRPGNLREPDEGDEQPIELRVVIRSDRDATEVLPDRIAAFLPVRFVRRGDADGAVRVGGLGRLSDRVFELSSPGLSPGRVRISGPGGEAVLRVVRGG